MCSPSHSARSSQYEHRPHHQDRRSARHSAAQDHLTSVYTAGGAAVLRRRGGTGAGRRGDSALAQAAVRHSASAAARRSAGMAAVRSEVSAIPATAFRYPPKVLGRRRAYSSTVVACRNRERSVLSGQRRHHLQHHVQRQAHVQRYPALDQRLHHHRVRRRTDTVLDPAATKSLDARLHAGGPAPSPACGSPRRPVSAARRKMSADSSAGKRA